MIPADKKENTMPGGWRGRFTGTAKFYEMEKRRCKAELIEPNKMAC